jgi:hypothetical protein
MGLLSVALLPARAVMGEHVGTIDARVDSIGECIPGRRGRDSRD